MSKRRAVYYDGIRIMEGENMSNNELDFVGRGAKEMRGCGAFLERLLLILVAVAVMIFIAGAVYIYLR